MPELIVRVIGDADHLNKTFRDTSRNAKRFDAQISGVGKSITRGLATAGLAFFSARGIIQGLETSVTAASDLNEEMSKTRAVFGKSADSIEAWSRTTANAFGISQRQALGTISGFGALFSPMGIVGQQAAAQSRRLVELGADLASFYNTDVQSALDAIRSGIVGESEPLRRYGVQLSEAKVQAEALAATGKTLTGSLTVGEKTLARQAIILRETALAHGDAAKTGDQFAGQMRRLNAQVDDLQASLGSALLPYLTEVAKKTNVWLSDMENRKQVVDNFTKSVEALARVTEAGARTATVAHRAWSRFTGFFQSLPGGVGSGFVPVPTFGDFTTAGGLGGGGDFGGAGTGKAGTGTGAVTDLLNRIRSFAAGGQALGTITNISGFIGKYIAMGEKFQAAQDRFAANQKKAAARRAQAALQRQRLQAGLENQLGWLDFGIERAEATKTLADDRRRLRKKEEWLENRIRHEGRTLNRVRELWRVRQQIRDLNKKKAADGDPLAGLMQVSSKRMAGILAQGTGITGAGLGRLQQNISGQEIQVSSNLYLDGDRVGSSVTRHQARTAHRTSRQTSGLRG